MIKLRLILKGRFTISYKMIAMTDQEYYPRINNGETINIDKALIVISIPKECDYIVPQTGERKAFKFVSKIFPLPIQG